MVRLNLANLKSTQIHGTLQVTDNIISTSSISVNHNKKNTPLGYTAKRVDTETEMFIGIDSNGINHGIYSNLLNKWILYVDNNNCYLKGNADSASKLLNSKNISLNGDINGSGKFNGSKNLTIKTTLNNSAIDKILSTNLNELNTDNKTLIGAINELLELIKDLAK